jgi:uncharacterized protein YrrD
MINANDLDGRAVVDLESATKVGYVDEIYLDTDGGRIAAYLVSAGSKLTGGGKKVMIPASAVQTFGPEAIMVRPVGGERVQHGDFERLPRLSHVKGRKVVSEGGKLLGTIDDVLLDEADGHIHGYTLKSGSWTDTLMGNTNDHPDYVRGDADLRLGDDLLVVPESAVVVGKDRAEDMTRDDTVVHREGSSAIDDLSSDRPVTRRGRMTEATPPRVEYAEPIGHTDTTFTDTTIARPATRAETGSTDRTQPFSQVEHWDDVRSRYRTRWEQRTAGRGGLWEEHEPGYRYGWEMANRPDFRGRTWNTAEPELKRDWETRHHDRPWDRVADAIRDTWDDVTGRDESDVAGYRSPRHHDDAPDAIERLSESPTPTRRRVVDEGPDSRRSRL